MNLEERFRKVIQEQRLFDKNQHLLLTVSGGLDSVVLAHLCKAGGYSFSIAHCNFGLRGEESRRDEAFVNSLAAQLNVPFYVAHFDTTAYAKENKVSIQVAARQLRYNWFQQLAKERNVSYVLTAHHANDNAETVLMNLAKGTGLAGLTGISFKRDDLVRPLLFATKEELAVYAKTYCLEWVEDSSNDETKYTRNHFRHEVIPAMEKVFPNAIRNVAATAQRLEEAHTLYEQAVSLHKEKLLEQKGDEVHIPVLKLAKTTPLRTILYEIIKDFGFGSHQVVEAEKLLSAESGSYIVSATHRIIRNRAWLIIVPLQTADQELIIIEEGTTQVSFTAGNLLLKEVNKEAFSFNSGNEVVFLNESEVSFPLLLRPWKAGDYFYPLGMKKKKKLSRFFIDAKLSKTEKEAAWVIESNKRIVWIVGHRIDDRFKITPSTQAILRLTFQRKS